MSDIKAWHISDDLFDHPWNDIAVQSTFGRAVNFLFSVDDETRIFTVLIEGVTLVPDSVIVSEDLFSKVRDNQDGAVTFANTFHGECKNKRDILSDSYVHLYLPKWNLSCFSVRDSSYLIMHLYQVKFFMNQHKKSDLIRLPEKYQKYAKEFCQELLANDSLMAEWNFFHMVGAGKGLTPACDDVSVGIMAVICAWLQIQYGQKGILIYEELTKSILQRLKNERYTTLISNKYLKCACRGYFSQLLCILVECIFVEGQSVPDDILEQIMQIGHTSGADMLYGVVCALEGITEVKSFEKSHNIRLS